MKKITTSFCSLAMLSANCCAMAGAFTVVSIVEGLDRTDPGLLIWLLCLSGCYVGLELFLRRERSERSIIFFCGTFFALQLVLVFVFHGAFSRVVGMLIAVCMWLYSYYSCYELAMKPLTAEKITKSFDLCSLVLVFALFFCSVKKLPLQMLLPMAGSTLLCLLALVLIRGGGQRSFRSVLISSGLILGFAALSAIFVALASGGVKKLIYFVGAAVSSVVGFVFRVIDAVFKFIAGLFPEKQYEMLAPVPTESVELGPPPDMSFEPIDPELVMCAMIAVGILIAAAFIAYRIIKGKRHRIMVKSGTERGLRRNKKGLAAALKRAFSSFFSRLAFSLRAIKARNTAPGLFRQIERRSRAKLHGRAESESCREFLARAGKAYPHAHAELEKLADAMDSMCFGGAQGPAPAEIIKMRRIIFSDRHDEA